MTVPTPPFATFDLARFRCDLWSVLKARNSSLDRLAQQTGLPNSTLDYFFYKSVNPGVQVVAVLIAWSHLPFEDYIRIA